VKFIIDAQLPKSLSEFLKTKGYDSVHTTELTLGNKTTDTEINNIAEKQGRIVISKDNDFLESHLLKHQPPKLLIVKTGNITNSKLISIFDKNIEKICSSFNESNLIEVYSSEFIVLS
jgi:predicted nuclease of predicted toxin-antitoxin system